MQKDILGSAWMIIAAFFLTLMGVGVKTASMKFGMNPYELVFWRVMVAVIFLGTQAWRLKYNFRTTRPKEHFWRSLSGTAALLMFFYGVARLPLGTAVTLNYTSAFFLALLSVILLKERPPLRVWFALMIGMMGIILLLHPSLGEGQLIPALMCLGSGFGAGYAYLLVRELSLYGEPTWRIVFYFSVFAAVVSAAAATFSGWHAITWQNAPLLLGIGICATAGQLALTRAYRVGHKFTVAALSYLTVVFSTLYGVFFLDEILDIWEISGIILIVFAGIGSSLR